jgi:hypothetical protein
MGSRLFNWKFRGLVLVLLLDYLSGRFTIPIYHHLIQLSFHRVRIKNGALSIQSAPFFYINAIVVQALSPGSSPARFPLFKPLVI